MGHYNRMRTHDALVSRLKQITAINKRAQLPPTSYYYPHPPRTQDGGG